MTVSQFREITSIRINLEGFATEHACAHMNERYLAEIQALNSDFNRELGQSNPDGTKLISINEDWHFAIYRASEMPMLLQLIEALWLRVGPILNYDLRSSSKRLEPQTMVDHRTRLVRTLNYHDQLVMALKAGDVVMAKLALKNDIETAAEFIVSSGTLVISD
jgi:DNA-binding GntR family transcriptional regulator